jgi:hypothetical protein
MKVRNILSNTYINQVNSTRQMDAARCKKCHDVISEFVKKLMWKYKPPNASIDDGERLVVDKC